MGTLAADFCPVYSSPDLPLEVSRVHVSTHSLHTFAVVMLFAPGFIPSAYGIDSCTMYMSTYPLLFLNPYVTFRGSCSMHTRCAIGTVALEGRNGLRHFRFNKYYIERVSTVPNQNFQLLAGQFLNCLFVQLLNM